jgi:RNA polymerase sigma factor FliA
MPHACSVAASYCAKRAAHALEFDDCVQLTSIGLIESVDRFDPSFGIEFKAFAAWRMRGSLVDGIETMSEMQQQLASEQRMAGPSIACQLGDTGMLRDGSEILAQPFYAGVEQRERSEQLLRSVHALPHRERKVIRDHYFQQLPFNVIAAGMNLTKGRISQIHKRALVHLREALAERA